MYMLRFDMRAPEIGASTADLYSAATDMCEWAENHGALAAVLCEHHGSHDGYLPSPLILASAIAARTKRLPITIAALLLPFYDTVRLAEDMAVLDLISKGRVSYILARLSARGVRTFRRRHSHPRQARRREAGAAA